MKEKRYRILFKLLKTKYTLSSGKHVFVIAPVYFPIKIQKKEILVLSLSLSLRGVELA